MDSEKKRAELADLVVGSLARQFSTTTVLFHHSIAERLGLGPSDHKCLDLLLEHGVLTGSELAASTGLTSGAITGVVARLERAGYLRREPDPEDGRRQLLRPIPERMAEVAELFAGIRGAADELVAGFDVAQLETVAEFLRRSIDFAGERAAVLRAQARSGPNQVGGTGTKKGRS
ncbi:MarR family winged helix-turn-helix transcriptional regulator [Amycolatopsis palatopharyngis]|uniref:MarR family winged helix-turn-helix transcriptional regulator n=1 Tax=Amycolatopsis palatopharyngis TaxID=187982 RepID=UPI000E26E9DB|nr:MarR family transcriptional regulator [Amycolatopsis palatopharyngis]